jgi:hypothetical protein
VSIAILAFFGNAVLASLGAADGSRIAVSGRRSTGERGLEDAQEKLTTVRPDPGKRVTYVYALSCITKC